MKTKREYEIADQRISGSKGAPLIFGDFTPGRKAGKDKNPIEGWKKSTFLSGLSPVPGVFAPSLGPGKEDVRESTDYITLLTSHLGALPVKSAQFALSPLMESKLSARRNGVSILGYQNIKIQLIKVLYSIACILKRKGRILIIDPTGVSKQLILDSQVEKGVASGGDLVFSQGPWKAGTGTNWSQVHRGVWNWTHCKQFFGHSKRRLGDSVERVLQKRETSLWSGRKCPENRFSPGEHWRAPKPRLSYEKKT